MKYQTTRHKINVLFDEFQKNINNLNIKKTTEKALQKASQLWKAPLVLYDSDWFSSVISNPISGNLVEDFIDLDQYAYVNSNAPTVSSRSSRKTVDYPIPINFGFRQTLEIPEEFLPYVDVNILVKHHPNLSFKALAMTDGYVWDTSNYYRITGDGSVIYQGYYPTTKMFLETDITNGNILEANTSKWLYGDINFTCTPDTYELRNGYINTIVTIYDVTPLAGHPGYYTYKQFTTSAIDSITSSTVTGTGTLVQVTAYEDGEGNPQTTTVTTKNVTTTATLFADYMKFTVLFGQLWKNGVFQQVKASYDIYNDGDVIDTDFGKQISSIDYDDIDRYKLFYSSTRATRFDFNVSTIQPINLPTGTLPYTTITTIINPLDEYPVDETTVFEESGAIQNTFARIYEGTKIDTYRLFVTGNLVYVAPAIQEDEQDVEYIDEDYTQSGSTYARVAENRPGQTKSVWIPEYYSIEMKLLVTLKLPTDNLTRYKVEKEDV